MALLTADKNGCLSTVYVQVPDSIEHRFYTPETGLGRFCCNGCVHTTRACIPAFYQDLPILPASIDDVLVAWDDLGPTSQGPFITLRDFTGMALFTKTGVILFGYEPVPTILLKQRLHEFGLRTLLESYSPPRKKDIFSN